MIPILTTKAIDNPLRRHLYQGYLPNAYDTELTILEKLNKVIDNMNILGILTNEMLDDWNNFAQWIGEQGMDEVVEDVLKEWLDDGTLAKLLEDQVLKDYATKQWVMEHIQRQREITIHLSKVYTDGKEIATNEYQYRSLRNAVDWLIELAIPPKTATIISDEVGTYIWDEQVSVIDRDASFIRIDGTFDISVNKFTECYAIPSSPSNYEFVPALYGKMSQLPLMRGIYNMLPIDSNNNTMDNCVLCTADDKKDIFVFSLQDTSNMTCVSGEMTVGKFPLAGLVVANGSQLTAHGIKVSDIGNRSTLVVGTADTFGYGDGILALNGSVSANKAEIYRCGGAGLNISQGSTGDFDGAVISGNGHHGCLVTSGSSISIKGGDISYTLDDDLVAYASSSIDARDAKITGNKDSRNYGLIATMESRIMFGNGVLKDTQYGVMANRCSSVDCTNASISTYPQTSVASDAVRSSQNSDVLCSGANIKNNTTGDVATAEHGGRLTLVNAILDGGENSKTVVLCYDGIVMGQESNLKGGTENCILATRGGNVSLYHTTITGKDVVDNECVHAYGGKIQINECTIKNAYRAIVATRGGTVEATYADISSSDLACLAFGSKVDLNHSKISGKVQATQGGNLNISSSNITKVTECIQCYNGAIVHANEATSYTGVALERANFTMDTNTVKSTGIIFFDSTLTA